MDTERPHAEVGPDALDRAIQTALNIEPSPEFLARVRARIAEERPPRRWTAAIVPVAVAAVLAILVLFAVNTSRRPVSEPARPATAPREALVSGSAAPTAVREPAAPTPVRRSRIEPSRRAAAAPRLTDEARGLQLLVDTINRGSVIVVADDGQSSAQQANEIRRVEVAPLTIPSISVEPIPPVAE